MGPCGAPQRDVKINLYDNFCFNTASWNVRVGRINNRLFSSSNAPDFEDLQFSIAHPFACGFRKRALKYSIFYLPKIISL